MENLDVHIHGLPVDIHDTIWKNVNELRQPKRVLTDELRCDIETYHLLDYINANYKSIHGIYYEDWVDNVIVNVLNNNQGFMIPLHPCFHEIFPNETDEEIKMRLMQGKNTMLLWRRMKPMQRVALYMQSTELAMW